MEEKRAGMVCYCDAWLSAPGDQAYYLHPTFVSLNNIEMYFPEQKKRAELF